MWHTTFMFFLYPDGKKVEQYTGNSERNSISFKKFHTDLEIRRQGKFPDKNFNHKPICESDIYSRFLSKKSSINKSSELS